MAALRWDLNTIFDGGDTDSESFQSFVEQLKTDTDAMHAQVTAFEGNESFADQFIALEKLMAKFREASAFTTCLTSANVKDQEAKQWKANLKPFGTKLKAIETELSEHMIRVSEQEYQQLLALPEMEKRAFPLMERRERAQDKMETSKEQLAEALGQDGYHGWNDMYGTLVAHMRVSVDGETLSVGQANNKTGSSDRVVREKWSKALADNWNEHEDLFAETLNHLAGFRLALYGQRGWDDPLKEPLMINRMQKETLDAMWGAIEELKPSVVEFIRRKKALLDIDTLKMHDIAAPIDIEDKTEEIPFEQAAQEIERHFRNVSPAMADFSREAFDKKWIEAEDRDNKRPGGFCTTFPLSNQSRIFMTYNGTPSNVQTLAHELGHAFHQWAMSDMPHFATNYAMNVAETASTFAEQIIAYAAVQAADSRAEKIKLLDTKINRCCAFFMNIHARFLFEKHFYEKRKDGWVGTDDLKTLMIDAQKEAYRGELDDYDPYFWASKLHFFITQPPFYNFPYTFGYLFSLSVYQKAREDDTDFEKDYIALLKDTASMSVEELAAKHLDADITKKDFWLKAARPILDDIDTFMELTEQGTKA